MNTNEEAPVSASDQAVTNLDESQDEAVEKICSQMKQTAQRHRDVRLVLNFDTSRGEVGSAEAGQQRAAS